MPKQSDIKKAQTLLATAKKAFAGVFGEVMAMSFMPIEAELDRAAANAEAQQPYEGLTPQEVETKKAKEREEDLVRLQDEANYELAKRMEARNPKKVIVKPEEEPFDENPSPQD